MDPADFDPAKRSTCTSCLYAEDMSNYWTASVYFKSPENGSYKLVPQMANLRRPSSPELLPQEGGLTVYYMQPFGGNVAKTTSFKPVSLHPQSAKEEEGKGIADRRRIKLQQTTAHADTRYTGLPHGRWRPLCTQQS